MVDTKSGQPSLEELHALRERLSSKELDQGHLFAGWPTDPASYTTAHKEFLSELHAFAKNYNGGVEQYVRTGQRLLAESDSQQLKYTAVEQSPLKFDAPSLFQPSEELARMESQGIALVKKSIFVLVAGGLGERLGYSGIKVGLPVETLTGCCYLQHYLSWVRHIAGPDAPFVMMTSDDTHKRTEQLLGELNFDMRNVHLLKQETVFCFTDSAAHLAVKDGKLLRKPHGHGDVHSLLYAATDKPSGRPLMELWKSQGYEYIVFFQDTNAVATLTIPLSLAISADHRLSMNFTCIQRQPKEAVGLLCHVRPRDATVSRTVNIEYNEFEAVAKELTSEGGDCAAPGSEFSPFPGSINTLILAIKDYAPQLAASHGAVPEFINPKYTDETKTTFKPCRIESLMQDVALLFDPAVHRVGASIFDRFTYQPVKNSLDEAKKKVLQGIAPHCASSGEDGFLEVTRRRLTAGGLSLPQRPAEEVDMTVNGNIKVRLFPAIVADTTAIGDALSDVKKLFPQPDAVKISARSVLIVKGRVCIESLDLDGTLRVEGPTEESAAPLTVRGLTVRNAGWTVRPTGPEDKDEVHRIRGFVFEKRETQLLNDNGKL